ncbi:uncharacterized protein TNCV_847801 [Trichonephila clavipes]|uniref:Uncharacterized protein n=1 Tax=Trichonephila clavipes TaxID=2585209 RepID=A0A8X6V6R3_TRICX|nr:uncharacterized protein TNCV_847801 [Trichonephila clavipes]
MTLHSPTENSLAVLNHKILEANSQVQNVKLVSHQTCLSINRLWHELCDMLRHLIVRVHYFVRGGVVGHRSRASSKHLSPHLPVGSLDSSGVKQGCAAPEAARVGVGSTKKPTR